MVEAAYKVGRTSMRCLFPDPAPADPAQLISGLRLADHAPPQRPYTVVNFVASADGRASVDGGSTGLGDVGDRAVFHALRACADAVLVGTGTLRTERYGALARDPDVARLRRRLRLPAQPPLVTITRSGSIPRIPLLDDPGSTFIVYTAAEADLDPAACAATVEIVRRDADELSISAVLGDLRAARGVGLLLCEGGPSIFGELISARVCDELFLTLAAKLAGGDAGAITGGLQLLEPVALTLRWALEQDGSLYLRYGLQG